jgi:hypothetical protein
MLLGRLEESAEDGDFFDRIAAVLAFVEKGLLQRAITLVAFTVKPNGAPRFQPRQTLANGVQRQRRAMAIPLTLENLIRRCARPAADNPEEYAEIQSCKIRQMAHGPSPSELIGWVD